MEPTKDGLYKFDEMNFYVLESMDDLVRVIDSNKNIIYANRSMLKKMKFDPVGKSCKCKNRNTTELNFIKREAVLKPGATAALHKNAQFQVRIAFFGNQVGHLGCRVFGKKNRFAGGRSGF